MCVYVGPITKLFAWGEGDSAGRGLVCPLRTSERGGKGDCVKGGGGEEGERVKERAPGRPLMPHPSTLRLIRNAAVLPPRG